MRNGHLAAQSSRKGVAFLPKDVRLTKKQEELRITPNPPKDGLGDSP